MEKPTILIVDDNRDLRETLAELLAEAGYEPTCCEDGAAALAYLRSVDRRPILIVLDLMMPVMNGWQFRDQQLEDANLRSIPVVTMTANRGTPPLPDVETMLLKPFGMGELLHIVDKYRRAHAVDPPEQTMPNFTRDRSS